ncbi:MAG TPA: hypothetical protein VF092_10005, partial [Longimicrobium sp.]
MRRREAMRAAAAAAGLALLGCAGRELDARVPPAAGEQAVAPRGNDDLPPAVTEPQEQRVLTAPFFPAPRAGEPLAASTSPVRLGSTATRVVLPASALRAALASPRQQRFELRLEGVSVERNPGLAYHVYLNLPPAADPGARGPEDAHYLATLDFYEIVSHLSQGPAAARRGYTVAAEVTPAVRALAARGALAGSRFTVTLVPEGNELPGGGRSAPAASARIARVVLRPVPGRG